MTAGVKRKRCPRYGARVRSGRLDAHMHNVHGPEAQSRAGRRPAKRLPIFAAAIALAATIAVAAAAYYFLSPPGEEEENGPANGGGYTPKHKLGTGPDDFWTVYPAGHASSGQQVPFPSWVQQESASKVLLVLAHSEGCAPCVQQQNDIRAIMGDPSFQTTINYIDLLSGGTDARAQDCFSILDPEGSANYIPLTIIIVRTPQGEYLWHSWEGVTGRANLEGWLNDAMHYRINGVGA